MHIFQLLIVFGLQTLTTFLCLAGDPHPDQVLPRRLHQGAGELSVEVSQSYAARHLRRDPLTFPCRVLCQAEAGRSAVGSSLGGFQVSVVAPLVLPGGSAGERGQNISRQ